MQEKGNTPPRVEELISDSSFVNYCLGTNEADCTFWQTWVAENPAQRPIIAEAKNLVILLRDTPSEGELTDARERLFRTLGFDKQKVGKTKLSAVYRWMAAAALLLCCGIASLYIARQAEVKPIPMAAQSWIKKLAPAGKIMHIRLTDGSLVDLAAGSTLRYPTLFKDSARVVALEGDAKFAVSHNTSKPFVIQTADLDIRVLGTTFHVQSFQTDRYARVALFEGRVQVEKEDRSYVIVPGQVLVYDKQKSSFETMQFDPEEEQKRIEGMLIFNNASYAEVGQRLAHKYGIKFMPDPNIDMAFSGRISNESVEEVIEKLNFTTAYHFYLKSNTLIAKRK
ncbi:DUF4974 domain-containing protein [Sphingobacterium alkalisoli]|uniref:DUF4974 domain-containing protein n=1 Tax=Sphingobacterium alkalisoli TaxID=1874115 RepID=A0A4U0H585_9SPHI|nr:FecR family protein [Sphingobacterium alkalisoli]TJY66746.1 DUF4974 domain-containing protein [Sphingobacterium alkalisoli]GGH14465.1 anti-sigma factor [Sphingobacterium alkalisoli]